MSFNVTGYMKDIDLEIEKHRQEIAKHRLWISQLEDTRLMLQQREEMRAQSNGAASPFGSMHGAEIAVRDMEAGVLSHAAKTGALPDLSRDEKAERQREKRRKWNADYNARKRAEKKSPDGLNAAGNRRGMKSKETRASPGTAMAHALTPKIVQLLADNPASRFSVEAILDRLQLGHLRGKDKQPLYQALWALKQTGKIHQPGGIGTYQFGSPNPTP